MNDVPFDHHDAALLRALGYEAQYVPEHWEDVGGPENGPKIEGNRAFTAWTREDHFILVEGGVIVETGSDPYWNYNPEGL